MEMETLILERKEHFLWIKLNRPEALNALNTQMAKDLLSVAQDAALDQDIWVIGITSTTDKAFGVGADLKERKDMTAGEISSQRVLFTRTTLALKSLPQPVIAGVKGFALGGGLETALWADIIIAGENAQFGLPEVRVGLIPGNGGTQNLPRLIGKNRAKEMIFTGKRIDAQKAFSLGIVSKVVPVGKVEEAVLQLAKEICAGAPVAVRQVKKAIDLGMNTDLQTGLEIEIETYNVNLVTEDRQEGIRAFNEKRPPRWQGK
ncbi:MAG: enoyl-CoA hydratase [Deltaproteobacteria bacterium RBG_19FT_COMBO_52_11]|nr:MAG: enoyl-CoA hydratase [Deltaproteobacteria bacterium RBG_19FT_COMBO_52_11]